MKTFHLTLAKVGENLFDGEAVSVSVPGSDGMLEVLAEHEALVSELREGAARVKGADGTIQTFPVPFGGIIEVSHNQVTVLL